MPCMPRGCPAGGTSLLHEAVVDIVTLPNLSAHFNSAETIEQASARFASAAAMKSMNNEHFSVFLEKATYRCESCDQKREGEARIVLIRMLKQA